ncbi:hypothetical protein A2686_01095 [Candidatus Woesebacteria bacterium RIFCSPHIGHO2_01_FULL_38_10]|uniref:DUF218 domain-containing protein n=1 Tax=Candidatus Woesebacteria bacterium RIFCSPLOWO2_01_FULL_39_10b TaxID=1802517 RepID=A0A1F8B6S2_9BACT|nr:MAG: hypothetical protein A2686_01095 [Candidatus Woesebacteria bacterium RIFCSPHIGHO2_01_FULL_38_10]OGM59399.1 MAG: hypothetical protein A2892_03545 [Candidatus Woesebacteria bacterium RIFCSPLOWO2_01_FULL_39_10b]
MLLKNLHIDALLVHAYWFDNKSKNLLDTHNNLQILAADCLLNEKEIAQLVILGGKIDPHKEGLALIMYKELCKKLTPRLANKIFVAPNSLTLRQEVKNFRKLATKNNWQNIASLCVSIQLPRVKRAYKRIFAKTYLHINFITTEEVLNQYSYKKKVTKYVNSQAFKYLKINEILAGTLDSIPVIGGYLIDLVTRIFPKKGVFFSKIFSIKNLLV